MRGLAGSGSGAPAVLPARDGAQALLARDGNWLYGLLRLLLPGAPEAERALVEVLSLATARADRSEAMSEREWLMRLVLERLTARTQRHAPSANGRPPESGAAERPARGNSLWAVEGGDEGAVRLDPRTLEGVNDKALATLVRALPLPQRQAVVLRVICRLYREPIAGALDLDPAEVDELARGGVAAIEERIAEHQARDEQLRRELWEANPYRLRPINGMSPIGGRQPNFSTVVKGTEVFIAPSTPGLLVMLLRAFKAILDLFKRHDEELDLDEDVGNAKSPRTPDATPGQRQFERPKRTPSLTDYRTPRLTPGVAVYAMPRSTPTTQRLSNPHRPIPPPSWGTTHRGRNFLGGRQDRL